LEAKANSCQLRGKSASPETSAEICPFPSDSFETLRVVHCVAHATAFKTDANANSAATG
jgi:hypothetical protein